MATSAQYLTEYEKSQKRYQDLVSGQNKFTELVKQKLGEKTDYNKDLITQQNQLAENQLSLPSQLRSEFSEGPIRNPLQQEALIQSRQSALGSSVGSVADLLAARGQREQDILSSGANVYGTMLQGAGTAAENAWRLYQDRVAQDEAARNRAASRASAGGFNEDDLKKYLGVEETNTPSEADRRKEILEKAYAFARSKGVGVSSDKSGNIRVGSLLINPLTGQAVNTNSQNQPKVQSPQGSAFLNFFRRLLG
jgi:hypothetical protein